MISAYRRKLLIIHAMAAVLLALTWLAGAAIGPHAGTPMVAAYYVLHIFPGSLVFGLVLFYWLYEEERKAAAHGQPRAAAHFNRLMHHLYYALLLALPLTGIVMFFEPQAATPGQGWTALLRDRPLYRLHGALFYALLGLVAINLAVTAAAMLRRRSLRQAPRHNA